VDPNYATAYSWRGASYLKLGQDQRAMQDYNHSVFLEPRSWFYEQRGIAYYEMGQYVLSIQDMVRAIILDSTNAVAYTWKGNAYYELGNNQQGDAAWDAACRLDSQYCNR